MATPSKAVETTVSDPTDQPVNPYAVQALDPAAVGFQRISDVIESPDRWADLDQIDFEVLADLDEDVIVRDYIGPFESTDFEGREWVIVLFDMRGKPCTTSTGGPVIIKTLEKLRDEGRIGPGLGIIGKFEKKVGKKTPGAGWYANIR